MYWRGQGNGTFVQQPTIPIIGAYKLAMGDLNRDGRPDAVVAMQTLPQDLAVLINSGTAFMQPTYYAGLTGGQNTNIARPGIADFNGDGKPDLVIPVPPDAVNLMLGDGSGNLAPPTAMQLPSTNLRDLALADMDNDGRLDVVLPGDDANNNSIVMTLLGAGNGTFNVVMPIPTIPRLAQNVAVADFDGDGRKDAAAAIYTGGSGIVSVLKGTPGGLLPTVSYSATSSAVPIVTGDFNSDGKLDLVIGDALFSKLGVYYGNGDGTFRSEVEVPIANFGEPIALAAGDFNNDGKTDVVVSVVNASFFLYLYEQ
jgi:hypothetical protein